MKKTVVVLALLAALVEVQGNSLCNNHDNGAYNIEEKLVNAMSELEVSPNRVTYEHYLYVKKEVLDWIALNKAFCEEETFSAKRLKKGIADFERKHNLNQ